MQARRIPKVRKRLRCVAGGNLFTPQAVTIGPYHHHRVGGSPPFPWTDRQKEQAVRDIERLLVDGGRNLEGLEQVVAAQLEDRVRECYTHPLHPEMVDHHPAGLFSRMLLRDGCYQLSFFINFRLDDDDDDGGEQQHSTETTQDDNTLVRDILYLLENQVPLFLLDRMYEHIVVGEPTAPPSAVECIAEHVQDLLQKQLYISDNKQPVPVPSSSTCCDLLHLVYSYFRRRRPQMVPPGTEQGGSPTGRWRRATDYSRHADVRFCRRVFTPGDQHENGWTILDICYDRGTLYMPLLRVGGSTLTMLRNLMALEEQQAERPVTAYCYLLSQLSSTAEDVALLQDASVLEHFLGSDDQAARGFAELCNGVALDIDKLDRNYLKPIWHQLDRRCGMPVHGFKGIFREQYGSSVFNAMVF